MAPKITFNKQDEEEDDESSDDNLEDEAATGKKREGSSRIENKFSAAATVAVMAGNCFHLHSSVLVIKTSPVQVKKCIKMVKIKK